MLRASTRGGIVAVDSYTEAKAKIYLYGLFPSSKPAQVHCEGMLVFDPEGKGVKSDMTPETFSNCRLSF